MKNIENAIEFRFKKFFLTGKSKGKLYASGKRINALWGCHKLFWQNGGSSRWTVRFVKRKSKIGAQLFAKVLISGHISDPGISLEKLCMLMKKKGVRVTRQGLDQRFNMEATLLMQRLLSEALNQFKEEKEEVLDLLKRFSGVKMIDSSGIELPANLKEQFRGYGGGASEAALKLQTMFDYTQGQLDEVVINDTFTSDQGFKEYWNWIEEGALYLQDLGYFAVPFFEQTQEKKAYFISRYLNPTTLLGKGARRWTY